MKCNVEYYLIVILLAEVYGYPELLFANRKDIRVIDIQRGKITKNILVKDVDDASSVDYYYKKRVVCWTDIDNELIKCITLDKSREKSDYRKIKVINRGIISPDGIGIDWLTEKLYWADSETDKIEVAELYGDDRKLLYWTDLDQPRDIALVPSEGIMFWSDWGERPKIERAGMNGDISTRKTIIDENIYWPNGLTVDYKARIIYWADGKHSLISSSDFDGKNRVKVFDQIPYPFSVTFFDKTLYWTDRHTKSIHYCHLNDKRKCVEQEKLSMKLSPMYIHAYDESRQPFSPNPCDADNGGCSNLCLLAPSPKNYSCGCSTGVKMKDEFSCEKGPNEMLILARRSDIRRISLDTPDRTPVVLPVSNVFYAIAVDYDPVEEFFYWTDDKAYWIQRARLNGSDQETLIHSEGLHLDGVAIDWLARNLYWSDIGNNLIEVAKLDGTSRKILLMGELDKPRAIAVYPEGGLMFWSDWGKKPKIERANLDGSDRKTIVTTNLEWPNGVAIDYEMKRLYWADAYTHSIEVAEFDGSNRQIFLEDDLAHVFGFSLLGNYLYWTDWHKRSIERVHKDNGTLREMIVDQLPNVMGLKAISKRQALGFSPCKVNNGGCSHLCFNRPNNSYVCDCPISHELDKDAKMCVVPKAFILYTFDEGIRRVSLNTSRDSYLPVPQVAQANALDFDSTDSRLYWSDLSSKSIFRAFMNGSKREVLVDVGLNYPSDIAVDTVSRNLYWTDMVAGRIGMLKLDGSAKKTLLWNIKQPKALAVDPFSGFIFWSEWNKGRERIVRAFMDGSNEQAIVMQDVGRVGAIVIDHQTEHLIWLDVDKRRIESSSYGGFQRKIIVSSLPKSSGLTLYNDHIFWSNLENQMIERAHKVTGKQRSSFKTYSKEINDLAVFHFSSPSHSNSCSPNNGGCSHLCIPTSDYDSSPDMFSHKCVCPTHFTLNQDGISCTPPQSFILFSQKTSVTRLAFLRNEAPTEVLPLPPIKNVKSIAFDPVGGNLFWIDGNLQNIRKANHNGSDVQSVVKGDQIEPFDLVVDAGVNLVFWSCSLTNAIKATRTDGTLVGNVMSDTGHDKPQSLAIHSGKGYLFFVNVGGKGGNPPAIERISLSGLMRETLIRDGLRNPFAITVDSHSDNLYWIDVDPLTIEMASIDGTNRKILIDSYLKSPKSLAILGEDLYWIDSEVDLIEKSNKISGTQRTKVLDGLNGLTDILAIDSTLTDVALSHPCRQTTHQCSHYCVVDPFLRQLQDDAVSRFIPYHSPFGADVPLNRGERVVPSDSTSIIHCECPHGMSLGRDKATCFPKPVCPPNHFTCLTGTQDCILIKGRCDGLKECSDGSDEHNCPSDVCGPNFFHCSNGRCIDNKFVCDRIAQCIDGSDERDCCPPGQAMCKLTGKCTPCSNSDACPDIIGQCPFSITDVQTDSNITFTMIGIAVCIGCVIAIISIICYKCKGKHTLLDEHPLNNHSIKTPERYRVVVANGKMYTGVRDQGSSCGQMGQYPLILNGGIGGQATTALNTNGEICAPELVNITQGRNVLLDRAQVTGASSSSSSLTHYPRETLNPPPTPVVEPRVLHCHELHCCCSSHAATAAPSTTINSYRHYKSNNRPPPPTPCLTDACDDSDFCSSIISPHNSHCFSPASTCYSSPPPTDYDSDPCPPPPTPLTHYGSFPPSPSTERSSCFMRGPCPSPLSPSLSD